MLMLLSLSLTSLLFCISRYYSSTSGISTRGYKLPLAYFLTAVLVYIYSFVATLRK